MVGSCPAYGRDPAGGGRSWTFAIPSPQPPTPNARCPARDMRRFLRNPSATADRANISFAFKAQDVES